MELHELTDDAIDYILENVNTSKCNLKDRQFVESVADQWDRKRWLSDGQKQWLGDIWDRQP